MEEVFKIEAWPPEPLGGQQTCLTPTGVRVEHLPTGLVAIVANERSRHRNKEIAMDMIRAGLANYWHVNR